MRIEIKNARIIDPAQTLDAVTNLYVADGRVVEIAKKLDGFVADRTIDATGLWLIPGLVDIGASLGEPGSFYQGSIESETAAAASAGITTVACLPDTTPVNDTQAVTELIQRRARQAGNAFVLPIGAITQGLKGEMLSNMASLRNAGCVALSQANSPIQNPLTLKNAMAYAASNDILLMMRCENQTIKNNGVANAGVISSRLGLPDIPHSAETVDLARDLILMEETGARVHFSQVSTAQSINMIAEAKKKGLPVTCDVAAHQLHLTEFDILEFDSLFHVSPPLRTHDDKKALRQALDAGIIDAVVSHHQPLDRDDKLLPFPESEPGISGLETLLHLVLKCVDEHELSLERAIKVVTSNPAQIVNQKIGSLAVGNSADFVLLAPESPWILQRNKMLSAGDNSPFQGWEFSYKVKATYFQGRNVFND